MILNKKKFIKIFKFGNFYNNKKINLSVKKIEKKIIKGKENALKKIIKKYDNIDLKNFYLKVKNVKIKSKTKKIIDYFIKRVLYFHIKQKKFFKSWYLKNKYYNIGQLSIPINKVMVYVPGGSFFYLSSLIMNIIPAFVSGVRKIFICTPIKNKFKYLFYICKKFGIKKIFRIGGAQAVFSFSYGLKKIPKVDKIVGPGNIYFSLAKKKVFGNTGIDVLAGPTELLIIFDKSVKKKKIFYEIMAQKEHDIMSKIFLLSNDIDSLKFIYKYNIKNIYLIFCKNLFECIRLSNIIAPEHLDFFVKDYKKYLKYIKNFGSIFIGGKSTEVLGDYCSGLNHVLPTNSNSKFSSSLGVYSFLKFSNILEVKNKNNNIIKNSSFISKLEGFKYHSKALYD
ncbi:histidinol dehydrogenase [Candidatus Vidania fulgoroideorum]